MNFLKKHYEKLILAVFLIVFIASLVIQLKVVEANRDIDVVIKIRDKAYKPVLPDQNEQKITEEATKDMIWVKSKRRNQNGVGEYTDFTQPLNVTFCPKCTSEPEALQHPALIRFDYLGEKACPYCGGALPKKVLVDIRTIDSDGDGIPDEMERRIGLNPCNPFDGLQDLDKDGFSTAYEITQDTNPNDPTSYPAPVLRLYVNKITKPIIGVKLIEARQLGARTWFLRVTFKKNDSWGKNQRIRLNDVIEVDGVSYVAKSVAKVSAPNGQGALPQLTLVQKDDEKNVLNLVENQEVYSKDVVADIKDISNNTINYNVKLNDMITILMSFPKYGTEGYRKEHKYKVTKIYSSIENKVDLKDLETGKVYTVGPEANFSIGPNRSTVRPRSGSRARRPSSRSRRMR
ncbi:hypothetical protein AAEX28_10170 [Lentisphaerota bacterium WC36G]|nr:hypothetical protein LJT99_13010 [Lentisphaerae bacterium WC36]